MKGVVFSLLSAVMMLSMPLDAREAPSGDDAGPVPDAEVARAQFTSAVKDREPVDQLVVLTAPARSIFFFTDVRNMEGRVVVHNWEYQGKLMSVVPFQVGGPRWRVFSRMELEPQQTGEWSVVVTDKDTGWPLYTELFRYDAASAGASGQGSAPLSE